MSGPVERHALGGDANSNRKLAQSGTDVTRATAVTGFVSAVAPLASAVRVVAPGSPRVTPPHMFRQPVPVPPGAPSALTDHFRITVLEQDAVAKVVATVSAERAEAGAAWLADDRGRKMNSRLQAFGTELEARIREQLAPFEGPTSCGSRRGAGKRVGCEQAEGGVSVAFAAATKGSRKAAQHHGVCPWAGATAS